MGGRSPTSRRRSASAAVLSTSGSSDLYRQGSPGSPIHRDAALGVCRATIPCQKSPTTGGRDRRTPPHESSILDHGFPSASATCCTGTCQEAERRVRHAHLPVLITSS